MELTKEQREALFDYHKDRIHQWSEPTAFYPNQLTMLENIQKELDALIALVKEDANG